MKQVLYAIGDIHGRLDLLDDLHAHIRDHHQLLHKDVPAKLVYIGDYIDGGPESIGVIDRVMEGLPEFPAIPLLGNHEAKMLDCLDTDDAQVWFNWLSNGGPATLAALDLPDTTRDPDRLARALGPDRIAWLSSLPLYEQTETYLFVHAGIAPGIPLSEQDAKDLLWIRTRFLESDEDHGFIVVHGHTPGDDPVVKPNRICIDTGATSNGVLTAAVLAGQDPPLFLRAASRS